MASTGRRIGSGLVPSAVPTGRPLPAVRRLSARPYGQFQLLPPRSRSDTHENEEGFALTRRGFATGLALVLTVSACGAATSVAKHSHAHRVPVGASTAQSQLLSQIVSSVQPSGISSASIGSPPSDFQGGPSSWVTISIPPGDQEANIADEWKSALVAGTFRDLSVAQGLPGVAGYTTPQGSTVIGAPDHPAVDAAPTQQSIQAALQQAGLRPTSVHFLAPGEGMAVMATATTNDAAKFLSAHPDPATAIFGDINRYAGTYLEVDDAQGVAFVTAYASVDGEGVGWMRPTLKTTSSNIHSEERALARQSG